MELPACSMICWPTSRLRPVNTTLAPVAFYIGVQDH
jgi:hypothetical protein